MLQPQQCTCEADNAVLCKNNANLVEVGNPLLPFLMLEVLVQIFHQVVSLHAASTAAIAAPVDGWTVFAFDPCRL